MAQDFDNKISIVVNKELLPWQVLSTVSHISAYFGNLLGSKFSTGKYFQTQDGIRYPRNSQYAIIVLSARPDQLQPLAESARAVSDVQSMLFIREMLDTTNDTEIIDWLSRKDSPQVELLGLGIFGNNQRVKELTKKLKLWS